MRAGASSSLKLVPLRSICIKDAPRRAFTILRAFHAQQTFPTFIEYSNSNERTVTMSQSIASQSGTFRIGGDIEINRLGFGAMRITGRGIWGEPADKPEAIRTLQRLPDLGVNFIDTANSYGPDVSELLIKEALHPYGDILVATKAGLTREGPDRWTPKGDPKYLIDEAHKSLRQLGVDQIGLWQQLGRGIVCARLTGLRKCCNRRQKRRHFLPGMTISRAESCNL